MKWIIMTNPVSTRLALILFSQLRMERIFFYFLFFCVCGQKYLALRRKSKLQTVITFWDQIYFVEDDIILQDSTLKGFFFPRQIHLIDWWA